MCANIITDSKYLRGNQNSRIMFKKVKNKKNKNGKKINNSPLLSRLHLINIYLTIKHDGKCSCKYSNNSGDAPAQFVSSNSSKCRICIKLDKPLDVNK